MLRRYCFFCLLLFACEDDDKRLDIYNTNWSGADYRGEVIQLAFNSRSEVTIIYHNASYIGSYQYDSRNLQGNIVIPQFSFSVPPPKNITWLFTVSPEHTELTLNYFGRFYYSGSKFNRKLLQTNLVKQK